VGTSTPSTFGSALTKAPKSSASASSNQQKIQYLIQLLRLSVIFIARTCLESPCGNLLAFLAQQLESTHSSATIT
jgi:hypothetical protein